MWVMLALATPVQFWSGSQFYAGAWKVARHRSADMNTLIAVGTGAAYLYSVVATVAPRAFEPARPAAGRLLRHGGGDHRADPARPAARGAGEGAARPRRSRADRPAAANGAGRPRRRRARRVRSTRCVPGDVVLVRPGEKVPVDGDRDRGQLDGRRVDAHRREPAGGEGSPATRSSAPRSTGRLRSGSAPRRSGGDGAGADRPAGRGGAGLEGADPALADRVSARFVPVVIAIAVADVRRLAR